MQPYTNKKKCTIKYQGRLIFLWLFQISFDTLKIKLQKKKFDNLNSKTNPIFKQHKNNTQQQGITHVLFKCQQWKKKKESNNINNKSAEKISFIKNKTISHRVGVIPYLLQIQIL